MHHARLVRLAQAIIIIRPGIIPRAQVPSDSHCLDIICPIIAMSASGLRPASGSNPPHVYLMLPEDQGRRQVIAVTMEDLEVTIID